MGIVSLNSGIDLPCNVWKLNIAWSGEKYESTQESLTRLSEEMPNESDDSTSEGGALLDC